MLQALRDDEPEVFPWYSKNLTERLLPALTYKYFGRQLHAPKLGTTIQFRKFNPHPAQLEFFEKAA